MASIDQTMERLESQMHQVNHAQRAMAEPLKKERVREVLQELKLPDVPRRNASAGARVAAQEEI